MGGSNMTDVEPQRFCSCLEIPPRRADDVTCTKGRAALLVGTHWGAKRRLSVGFIGGSVAVRRRVADIAKIWADTRADLSFDFWTDLDVDPASASCRTVAPDRPSHVTIALVVESMCPPHSAWTLSSPTPTRGYQKGGMARRLLDFCLKMRPDFEKCQITSGIIRRPGLTGMRMLLAPRVGHECRQL